MSENEDTPPIDSVGDVLAPQLGSDQKHIAKGEVDIRRFTVVNQRELKFVTYGTLRAKKSELWKTIMETYPNWKVSVGGRGRRDLVRMEVASKGGGDSGVVSEMEKPNIFARNLWKRDWKKKQEETSG